MIKLSQKSLILLKKCLEAHAPHLLSIIDREDNDKFDEEFYNELREAVCDEFLLKGLEGDKPTKYGLELEDLIDEIGRLFM